MNFFVGDRPMVIAHRGGAALGPENTLAAFDLAAEMGVDGIELDVRLAADGAAVVHHDLTLDRTTSGSGPLAALSSAELRGLDAAVHFQIDGAFPFRGQGHGVPTLREVLLRYSRPRIIIEMKVDSTAMAAAVVRDIWETGSEDRVCLAGFGQSALKAARTHLPAVASSACQSEVRAAVMRGWMRLPAKRLPYGGYQVSERHGSIRIVTPRFIRHAHGAGLKVQVWTVDDEADMRRLLKMGVDGLITNRPDVALRLRDEKSAF